MIKKITKFTKKLQENKLLKILYGIGRFVFTVVLLMILFVIVMQKVTDNSITVGGVRIFSVASGSMMPKYEIGDIIITKQASEDNINVGDVVTYMGEKGSVEGLIITHEVINKRVDEKGVTHFITKGTANEIEDPEINYSQVYGKVVYKTLALSYIGRMMKNIVAYYIIFTVVGLLASIQIVRAKFAYDEEVEEEIEDRSEEKE